MSDPGGTGLEVPILGTERETESGLLVPIGGTMEDPNGAGPVPISLGTLALDTANNQVGPVCGARREPESKLVVPVTMGETPPPSNRGSPIQISMLEEELLQRTMFWRRQRVRENEINNTLLQLKAIIIDALPESLEEMSEFTSDTDELLATIERDTKNMADSHTKEVKRRGDMSSIYAQQLPPVAVAITTENDEEEGKREIALHQVFGRIPEVIQRHMKKVREELKKFLERCQKSPHGTEAAREKHEAMTERLQNDIKTQLLNRFVTIDENSSSLEYIRERAELCGVEAKIWLSGKGSASWTSTVTGMYGDLPASSSSHKDLIPLIEKLIELLKSSAGKDQFVRALAGALVPPQGGTLVQTMEHLVQRPAVIQSTDVAGRKPTSKIRLVLPDILEEEVEEEESHKGVYNVPGGDLITQLYTASGQLLDLTYRAGRLYDSQDNIINSLFKYGDITYGEDGKLYDQSGGAITLLYRPDGSSYPINYENTQKKKKKRIRKQPTRVKVSLSDTDPKKMAMRQLLEKHTLETVELEDQLNRKKIEVVNKIIGEAEEKKRALKKDIQTQLRIALQNAADTDDKSAIMMRYADMLDLKTGEIEEDKKRALREMMEKLADEIVQKKTALRQKQLAEIDSAGLTEEVEAALPHLRHNIVPNRSKIAEDLEKLAKQQEILAAEMKKYLAEDQARACMSMDGDIRKELDREMEERCKRMTSLGSNAKVVTDTIRTTQDAHVQMKQRGVDRDKMQQNMRKRMQKKQQLRRRQSKVPNEDHLKGAIEKEDYETEETVYSGEVPEDMLLCEDYRHEVQYDADLKDGMAAILETVEEHQREQDNSTLIEELNAKLQSAVAGESDAIMAAYKESLASVSSKLGDEKTRSANTVAERLEARKKLREQRLTREVDDEVLNEVGLAKIGLSESEVLHEVNALSDKIHSQSLEELKGKKEQLLKKFESRRSTLVTELSLETEDAKKHDRDEEAEREKALARSLDDKTNSILAAANEKFNLEMQGKEEQLQQDEKDRLLTEHKAGMSKLSQTLSTQKDSQVNNMKARLEERKKMKEQKLKEKQEADLQRIREQEEVEQFRLEDEEARKKEKAALTAVVHDMVDVGMDAKAQSLIHHLLSQRHLKARIVLEKEQKSHLKTEIQQARSDVLHERDDRRDEILTRQEKEMTALLDDALNLSPELLEKKQEELKRKHNKELNLFDDETEDLLEHRIAEVTAEQKVEAAHQLLLLKEEQLLEMSRTLRDMTGDEEAASKYAEQAEQLAGQAQEHRDRVTRETEEKMKLLKEEKLKREEAIKVKMASELNNLEKELHDEEKRHQLREQEVDKQHDLLARRKLIERDKELQSEMRDASSAEKDAILARYDEDVKKISSIMNNEKDKSRNKLKDQLEARRNKRKQAMIKKIEEKGSDEQRELDDQIRSTKSSTLLECAESLRGVAGTAFLPAPTQSDEASEEERNAAMMKLFENTDIFKQLSSIEEMLGLKAQNALKISGKDKARPYIDLRDAQWSNSDTLRPMDVSKLSPSNFVTYRFGLFLSRLLKSRCDFPKVTVLLADTLPHNNYLKNAYRHSYHYEDDKEILFVRKERTESVGEFCVVVAHALAHIKIGDMRDDNHPFFLRHFYRALRVICTDMFFGRASHSPLANISLDAPASNSWEYALSLGRSKSEKYNVVNGLVDLRVSEPSQLDFSPHQLLARLETAKQSNLREELSTLITPGDSLRSNYLENKIEKLNDLLPGSVKLSYSKKINSYDEILEQQRASLGLQIDDLSTEILDNARNTNDVSQSLSVGDSDARTSRLENLGSARQYIADKIQLLNKERLKKVPQLESES